MKGLEKKQDGMEDYWHTNWAPDKSALRKNPCQWIFGGAKIYVNSITNSR